MAELNGVASIFPKRPANGELVSVLRQMLARAEAGEIVSGAFVYARGPSDAQVSVASGLPMELYVGADMLKGLLMQQMTGGGVLRPR